MRNKDNFFWFETNKFDKENYRSYYFFDPVKIIKLVNPEAINEFFQDLEDLTKKYYVAGFFSYELGYLLEEAFHSKQFYNTLQPSFPYALFCAYDNPIIFNHQTNKFIKGNFSIPEDTSGYKIKNLKLNVKKKEYIKKINAIREYIRKGDVYQVDYTIKYKFDFQGSPLNLYLDLKKKQNVAYNVFAKFDDNYILSLSPELFFYKNKYKMKVKPMKGTVKRGRNIKEDMANALFLQNDEKNQSENVMIVDLLRNDIGKISETGSVKVKKLYEIERYNTLFQMTSTIESKLVNNISTYEMIKGIFPSGSIAGAPKIRSMEIINELENEERKVYTGSIGFFEPSGDAKFNVVIRTVLINKNRGEMGIGGGIVYDSTPEDEFQECILKAKFLTTKYENEFCLIETILFDKNYENLNLHMERMKESAGYFDYIFNEENAISQLTSFSASLKNGRFKVRILLKKSGELQISSTKLDKAEKAYIITVSKSRTDSNNIYYFHKTTNRALFEKELNRARKKGFFDVIFLNEKGEITEGAITNIYVQKNGIIYTPPVGCGLLNGTIRRSMIQNDNIEEKIITLNDLDNADKIYISNSIIGFKEAALSG